MKLKKLCIGLTILGFDLLISGVVITTVFVSKGYDLNEALENLNEQHDTATELMETYTTSTYNSPEEEAVYLGDNEIYKQYSAESGLNIDMSMKSADISISTSGANFVEMYIYNAVTNDLSYEFIGNTLSINYNELQDYFNTSDEQLSITILVPDNISLGNLNIDITSGSIDLNAVTACSLDISTVAAQLRLDGVTVTDSSDISVMAAEIDIYNSTLYNTEISSTAESVFAENAYLYGTTEINTAAGNIYLNLVGDPNTYGYDINKAVGEFTINGEINIPRSIGSTDNSIKISQTTGDCTIDFE